MTALLVSRASGPRARCHAFSWFVFCLLFACSAKLSVALNPSTPLREYLLKTWTAKEGLPQSGILALCRSKLGYLWLATEAGIVRFDGAVLTVLNSENTPGLPNSLALALIEDRGGSLWVGLHNGLAVIAGGKATAFTLGRGTTSDSVIRLQEDRDGVIWAGTVGGGLYAIKNGKIQKHLGAESLGEGAKTFSADTEGGLWIAAADGITRMQNGGFTHYPILEDGKPVAAYATFEDREHVRWAVTSTTLFVCENGRFRKWFQFSPRDLAVWAAESDGQGTIWIGTSEGLCRIHDRRLDTINRQAGLAGELVRAILPDADGSLWVASDGGLNYFQDGQFTTFPRSGAPRGQFVWSIVDEPGGGIWLATTSGVEHITGSSARMYTILDGLPSNFVYCVHRDRAGAIWIGTESGLSRWKNGKIQTFSPAEGMPYTNVLSVYETRDGKLLASAGFSGVFAFDGIRFSPLLPTLQRVYSMSEDREGGVLISTSRGLYRWRDGHLAQAGPPDVDYTCSRADHDGVLWAIDRLGNLVRIRDGKAVLLHEPGSPFHGLSGLLEDERENYWITSKHGLLRVSKKDLNDYLDGKLKELFPAQYTTDDGLPTDECNGGTQNAAWQGLDGRFWFATPRGAVAFDPRKIRLDTAPPPTLIETVVADGRVLDGQTASKLPPDTTRLAFKYTGIDFHTPQQTRFRYRMVNFDSRWMDGGGQRVAYYMNLPHGRYTFTVQARSRDGAWHQAGAWFAFEIAPHYYQTPWFYLLCAVIAGCSMLTAHLLRLAQVRSAIETALHMRVEERERIARELHDTLLQGIAGIAMQLRALMLRLPEGEAVRELGQILNRMERSTKETRLALRDLRLPGETARDLRTALGSFGRTMVADSDQRFEIEVTGEPFEVAGEPSQNLLRIGQEAILNAARHSEASAIRATIAFGASGLTLTIADNGKGFDVNESAGNGHWGLVGMTERAKSIGGQIEIASRQGAGTRITVTVEWPRVSNHGIGLSDRQGNAGAH